MRIVDQTEVQLEWSDMENLTYHQRPKMVRSSGVHVSGILKYIAVKMGKLSDEDQKDEMPLVVLLGVAFEEAAARLYPGMVWQPGEVCKDEIYCNPDGKHPISYHRVEANKNIVVPDEFKYTYKSEHTHGNVVNEWLWMQQLMAELNTMKNTDGLGMLHVCWACGNYRPPWPRYLKYLIEFSSLELQNNWRMLMKYRDKAKVENHG